MQASIGFILAVMARTGYVWLRLELNMTSLWEWESYPCYLLPTWPRLAYRDQKQIFRQKKMQKDRKRLPGVSGIT